ncbi:MAG: Mpo1-like protein [Polyangiaceae bacterium]
MNNDSRPGGLLAWQFQGYSQNHGARRNLLLHVLTVPLFQLGTLAVLSSPVAWWLGVAGLLTMVSCVALQGRGHRLEDAAPAAFRGPLDVLARLFVEQWVTFPRFVLSGGFGRAWRVSEHSSPPEPAV